MTDKEIEKIKRLTELRKSTGIKQVDFAKILGLNRANLSAIENFRENRMLPNGTSYILEKELNVNPVWFETGEGDVYLKKSSSNAKDLGELPSNYDLDETPFIELPGGDILMVFPLVEESAYAGYLSSYADPEFIEQRPKHSLIVQKYHKGLYRGFEIVGDSMDNGTIESIPDKSRVTGRFLQFHHWQNKLHIHRYKDFIIVHKTDGIIAKRIIKHNVEDGIITIHSLNPDKEAFPDKELHLSDIKELYNIIDVSIRR
jgi:transcriptional regulator with XRE-family HTH domain